MAAFLEIMGRCHKGTFKWQYILLTLSMLGKRKSANNILKYFPQFP